MPSSYTPKVYSESDLTQALRDLDSPSVRKRQDATNTLFDIGNSYQHELAWVARERLIAAFARAGVDASPLFAQVEARAARGTDAGRRIG